MAKSLTNIWTYVFILFIFSIFFAMVLSMGDFLLEKDTEGNADLSLESVIYISELNNIELEELNISSDELDDPFAQEYNDSSENLKDFAIQFVDGKKKASGFQEKVQDVYQIPTTFLKLFSLPVDDFQWIINPIFWLFSIGIGLAIYYIIRGVPT